VCPMPHRVHAASTCVCVCVCVWSTHMVVGVGRRYMMPVQSKGRSSEAPVEEACSTRSILCTHVGHDKHDHHLAAHVAPSCDVTARTRMLRGWLGEAHYMKGHDQRLQPAAQWHIQRHLRTHTAYAHAFRSARTPPPPPTHVRNGEPICMYMSAGAGHVVLHPGARRPTPAS
jgi:hypothetical protein